MDCSGRVTAAHLAKGAIGSDQVAAGAISASHVGFTWAGSKTKGGPATVALDLQCTGCVSLAELTIDGDLDLGGNALKAKSVAASTVQATTVTAGGIIGDGSKLTGIVVPAGSCKGKPSRPPIPSRRPRSRAI